MHEHSREKEYSQCLIDVYRHLLHHLVSVLQTHRKYRCFTW